MRVPRISGQDTGNLARLQHHQARWVPLQLSGTGDQKPTMAEGIGIVLEMEDPTGPHRNSGPYACWHHLQCYRRSQHRILTLQQHAQWKDESFKKFDYNFAVIGWQGEEANPGQVPPEEAGLSPRTPPKTQGRTPRRGRAGLRRCLPIAHVLLGMSSLQVKTYGFCIPSKPGSLRTRPASIRSPFLMSQAAKAPSPPMVDSLTITCELAHTSSEEAAEETQTAEQLGSLEYSTAAP